MGLLLPSRGLEEEEGNDGCYCSSGVGTSSHCAAVRAALSRSAVCRYQSEQLNSPKAMEMLELNGNEEERVVMNPNIAATGTKQKETLSFAALFSPSADTPTALSGRIVYVCASIMGE